MAYIYYNKKTGGLNVEQQKITKNHELIFIRYNLDVRGRNNSIPLN